MHLLHVINGFRFSKIPKIENKEEIKKQNVYILYNQYCELQVEKNNSRFHRYLLPLCISITRLTLILVFFIIHVQKYNKAMQCFHHVIQKGDRLTPFKKFRRYNFSNVDGLSEANQI